MTEDTMRPTGGNGWRRLRRAVLLNAGAFVLVTGAGECVVRAMPPAPSLPSHFEYEPGRTFRYASPPRGAGAAPEFDNQVVMNRYGFHGPDHPREKTAGRTRIAIIGDSMVEAFQVRREETVASRLEGDLPGVDALGFGMSGHSTIRQAEILRRLPGLLGSGMPDVVLFVVHGPYAVRQTLVDHVRGRALWRRGLGWALLHYSGPSLFLLRARDAVLTSLAIPADDLRAEAARAGRPAYRSDHLDRAWEILDGAVRGLVRESRDLGLRPVLVYIPDASEMEEAG